MGRWFRALAGFPEDLSSLLSTLVSVSQLHVTPAPVNLTPSFVPQELLYTQHRQTHTVVACVLRCLSGHCHISIRHQPDSEYKIGSDC